MEDIGAPRQDMEDIIASGQVMEDIMASGQVTVSDNNTEITLEGLSLEPHVVRRKRSLVSVLRRRLARSLHELEVCRIQCEEEEKGGLFTDVQHYKNENKHFRNANYEYLNQKRDCGKQKRRASVHFCSSSEINSLYCQERSQMNRNNFVYPLFMNFGEDHYHNTTCVSLKVKYNTLV